MRTVKKFTPKVLDRFLREQRGTGTGTKYLAWHQVSRGDPASRGRSHLLPIAQRHLNLLSDNEKAAVLFGLLVPDLVEAREQFKLALEEADHELAAYDANYICMRRPGTRQICAHAAIRHPLARGAGRSEPWVMTTDCLLTIRIGDRLDLLAVSAKDREAFTTRKRQLLAVERNYWEARGVPWLLITPATYHVDVRKCLERSWPWVFLSQPFPLDDWTLSELLAFCPGRPLSQVLEWLASRVGTLDAAQRAFWQAVWARKLPLDLRRGWRPHLPVRLLSLTDFDELNPVVARRSSWI